MFPPARQAVTIRPARRKDCGRLGAIEADVAPMFVEAGAREAGEPDHPLPVEVLIACQGEGLLWVAEDVAGVCGFIAAIEQDGGLWIAEIDVLRRCQGEGVGTRLLEAVRMEAAARSLPELTLTTDRWLPWNAPWYERRGFREVTDLSAYPALAAQLATERTHHHPPERRIAMQRTSARPISGSPA